MFIKIPATVEGLPAITQVLAEGISVNVTLIFSLDRYRAVMNAFLTGLEQAREHGHDLVEHPLGRVLLRLAGSTPRSTSGSTPSAPTRPRRCAGKAGIANARLAYQAYEEVFSTPRWARRSPAGRPPAAPAVGLHRGQGPGLPRHDVRHRARRARHRQHDAREDARRGRRPRRGHRRHGHRRLRRGGRRSSTPSSALGISYAEVVDPLEREGVEKFEKCWAELLDRRRPAELEKATA